MSDRKTFRDDEGGDLAGGGPLIVATEGRQMSDLSDALDYFDKGDDFQHRPEAQTVLDAARRVANPDIGEAAKVLGRFFGSGMTQFDLLEIADQTVTAALGITEDTG